MLKHFRKKRKPYRSSQQYLNKFKQICKILNTEYNKIKFRNTNLFSLPYVPNPVRNIYILLKIHHNNYAAIYYIAALFVSKSKYTDEPLIHKYHVIRNPG